MYRFFQHRRARNTVRALAATTFCEGCGAVCTPQRRREALQERQRDAVQRVGLYRF